MKAEYWKNQSSNEPLYPELLWSRPENRRHAGKLLIVGGNLHGFAAPAEAFATTEKAGIGVARVLLPDAIKKLVGPVIENGEFAPSTPSGSFSQKALDELLAHATWSDGVLFAGDLGRNSETSILLEKFIEKYPGYLCLTRDGVDYFVQNPNTIVVRQNTTIVVSMAQLQKLCMNISFRHPITFSMDLIMLTERLHELTTLYPLNIVVRQHNTILVACRGNVSTTSIPAAERWRLAAASYSCVWQIQNPTEPFKALSTAIFDYQKNVQE